MAQATLPQRLLAAALVAAIAPLVLLAVGAVTAPLAVDGGLISSFDELLAVGYSVIRAAWGVGPLGFSLAALTAAIYLAASGSHRESRRDRWSSVMLPVIASLAAAWWLAVVTAIAQRGP